ncbi:MAG: sensor histidine kinase [Labilithrix sp.]|nr:sensor histidine kinase [Labilithrix sp.]
MSASPSFAQHLRIDHPLILATWQERVRAEMPHGGKLGPRPSLREHVPVILRELAEELEGTGRRLPPQPDRHRAFQQYGVRAALEDLTILREVTVEHLAEKGMADEDVVRRVHRFFDRAMADAAEELMARSHASVRADADFRDHILGILSHDLRNPLSAITMALGLVLDDPQLRGPTHRAAERAAASAGRMVRMLRDLFDYARTQHDAKLLLEPAPCDASVLAREVVEDLRLASPGRVIELDAEPSVRGRWDRERLAQLLSHLIGNALQHGDPDAPVRVSLGAEGGLHVRVESRGEPIPVALRGSLFAPFERGTAGPSRNGNLGLGLYIVREIARAHGGDAELTASNPEATTFTVRLPKAVPARAHG